MSRCPSQQAANLNGTITPGLFLYADGHWVVPSPDSVGKASESTRGICAVSSGQEFADLRKLCTGRSLPGIAPLIGMSEAVFVMADCQRSPRAPGGRALGFCSEAAIAMAENRGAKAMLACSVSVSYYLVKSNAVRGFGEASVSALGGSDRCRSLSRGSRPSQADEGSMVVSYFRRLDRFAILSSQGGDAELRMHAEVCR